MTLLIWSQKLTNTQLDLTHRWGFWSSFWSRPRQQGFSLAGKGKRVLSLHSSVPWDLFYWTSLNNSIKTPKEAGWTCGLVFSCQKQGAAGQGGRKRESKEQERKHTHGKEQQPETERKEKVRGLVCVYVHVCICPCTPAPQHPWHLVRPIKQQHRWTPKNRQQCCGATNTNAQGVLSVGEGKGTSWMGNLEINIFHCKEQNSKATTIPFHVPIITIIPSRPQEMFPSAAGLWGNSHVSHASDFRGDAVVHIFGSCSFFLASLRAPARCQATPAILQDLPSNHQQLKPLPATEK